MSFNGRGILSFGAFAASQGKIQQRIHSPNAFTVRKDCSLIRSRLVCLFSVNLPRGTQGLCRFSSCRDWKIVEEWPCWWKLVSRVDGSSMIFVRVVSSRPEALQSNPTSQHTPTLVAQRRLVLPWQNITETHDCWRLECIDFETWGPTVPEQRVSKKRDRGNATKSQYPN